MYIQLVKVIFPHLKKYKSKAIGAMLLTAVLAAIQGYQLKIMQPLLDKGLSEKASKEEVYMLAGTLILLGVLNFPARFFHFYWLRNITEFMNADIRSKVFSKLQKLPTSFYNQNKQGKMLSHILNDAEVFANASRAAVDVVREPMKAMVCLGMAIYADWQLALVILIVGPLFVMIFQKSGKKIKNNQGNIQTEKAELTHTLSEGLASHKITKAFSLQDYVMSRFLNTQDSFIKFQMKTTMVEEIAHPFVELVGFFAFALVIIFAYDRVQAHALTTGKFIQFIGALAMMMDPIRKFSQANVKVGQGITAYQRLEEVFNLPEEIDLGTKTPEKFESSIEVSHLTFAYNEEPVVKDLSLKINKGQKVAFVGLSGSGKTTLINLLLGLYPIKYGSIKIDGNELKDIKLKNLRALFGLVSQDIFLFHDSIKENLMIGKKFSDAEINRALEVSYAKEFVDKLPEGIHTTVGDRGAKLSGGQQQRITIARAFLQNTEILLFDEATSALDNESEKVVQKALESIAGNKTVIAVAHRLSTIQDYDRIFVMKEGSLVEEGTHQELINKNGEYKKLYELSQKS